MRHSVTLLRYGNNAGIDSRHCIKLMTHLPIATSERMNMWNQTSFFEGLFSGCTCFAPSRTERLQSSKDGKMKTLLRLFIRALCFAGCGGCLRDRTRSIVQPSSCFADVSNHTFHELLCVSDAPGLRAALARGDTVDE
jgi:hypothetical protein